VISRPPARGYCAPVISPRAIRTHADVILASLLGAMFVAEVLGEAALAGHRGASLVPAVAFSAALAFRVVELDDRQAGDHREQREPPAGG